MFDLEQAVANWRKNMLAAGIQSSVQLDELESHLREAIQQRINDGVNEQTAFETSIQQIGAAGSLKGEFGKNDGGTHPIFKWLATMIVYYAAAAGCWVFLMAARKIITAQMSGLNEFLGLAAIVVSLIAILGGPVLQRFFPALPNERTRRMIKIWCLVPAVIWFPAFAMMLFFWNYTWPSQDGVFVVIAWTLAMLPVSFRLWKGFASTPLKQSSAISAYV